MAKKEKVYGTRLKVSSKRAGHKIGGTVGIFIFLLVLAVFMALPLYLAVVMSLKPVQELFLFPPKLYVIDPTLSNYSAMFRLCSDLWVPFSRYVFNSVFVTVVVTLGQVVFSSMAAFCLAKIRFPGAKAINSIIVVSLLYQSNVIYIMQYMVLAKLDMIDTYMALIFPSIAAPMNLFLMRQSMMQVPDAMIEAAKVDGANSVTTLFRIIIPSVMPSVTICLFLTITNSFKLFDQNLALTAGAPGDRTQMVALDIYNTFYSRNGYEGVGQAKAVIFFIIVAVIALLQLRLTRRKEVES